MRKIMIISMMILIFIILGYGFSIENKEMQRKKELVDDQCSSVITYSYIDGMRTKEVFYPECAGGGPGGSVSITEVSN